MRNDPFAHVWRIHPTNAKYIVLEGHKDAMVRFHPLPNGKYLFQFRNKVSYAETVNEAKEWVEACAEANSNRCLV